MKNCFNSVRSIKIGIIFLTCLFFLILLILYSQNYLLLGGEGNYITDFQLTKDAGIFTWVSHIQGLGFPSPILNALRGIFDLFALLQKLTLSFKVANIVSAWLVYILPFLSMFWLLSKILKRSFPLAYFVSLFYIINPFSTFHLQGLMFWNIALLFVLPLIFGVLYKYYSHGLKLFFFFGLLTSLLSFSLANIPYLGIFQIFLFSSLIIIPYMQEKTPRVRAVVKNIVITELSFLLFNAWWFLNLLRFQMQDIGLYYTKEFAVSWAQAYAGDGSIIAKLFSLTSLISSNDDNFFASFFYSIPMRLILLVPFGLLTFQFFIKPSKEYSVDKKIVSILALFVAGIMFFAKGANQPLGELYIWMLNHIPFFIIFKSPIEKFSLLFVFFLALTMIYVFKNIKTKWAYCLFAVYLTACSIPYLSLNFMPDFRFEKGAQGEEDKYISKKYVYKENYFAAAESLNKQKLECRYLSLPGSANYQVTLLNHDGNKYYRGMDPFVYSVNKPFITSYSTPALNFIFYGLSNDSIEIFLNAFNIRKIIVNQDLYPSFGRVEKELPEELISIFSKKYKKEDFSPITVFSVKDFLPLIYVPRNLIVAENATELSAILSEADYKIDSAIYFKNQLSDKETQPSLAAKGVLPAVEFKRINSIKYRVVLHQAHGELPVIFNESFHAGWKLYPTNLQSVDSVGLQNRLADYNILDGNEDDQATIDEVKNYIQQGFITSLGNGKEKTVKHWRLVVDKKKLDYIEKYKIDFVSKNFHGTIQNNNLIDGNFYETWRFNSLANHGSHVKVNGFFNSWIINVDDICAGKTLCQWNPNGTYDMELILEFSPQRLFYYGLATSIATLFLSLASLFFVSLIKKHAKQ
ncbi:MAG: hypothetical protein V1902_02955 [Candidatus Falkowbacteria bacterium]